jgi:hypothetical protein
VGGNYLFALGITGLKMNHLAILLFQLRRNECMFVTTEVVLSQRHKYSVDVGRKKCKSFSAWIRTPEGGLGGIVTYLVN